jgi:hypothetical protein
LSLQFGLINAHHLSILIDIELVLKIRMVALLYGVFIDGFALGEGHLRVFEFKKIAGICLREILCLGECLKSIYF